jgi:hypothetical protein
MTTLAIIKGVTCKRATASACLARVPTTDDNGVVYTKEIWIPKSQIHDDSEVYKPWTEGKLIIPEWLATAKGIKPDDLQEES